MPQLKITSNQHWDVEGSLTFETIAEIEKISAPLRENWRQKITIFFDRMTHIDSAGIAWVLENIKYSQQKKIPLILQNFHHHEGKILAKIHGVDAMLNNVTN